MIPKCVVTLVVHVLLVRKLAFFGFIARRAAEIGVRKNVGYSVVKLARCTTSRQRVSSVRTWSTKLFR